MTTRTEKTVLLAEDDSSMRRFVEITLQKAGYRVLAAEDGLSALQISFDNDIDIVVADAVMPNMSGYDLCRAMAEKKLPFIILSGLAEKDADSELADVFLTKDTNLKDELLNAIETLTLQAQR